MTSPAVILKRHGLRPKKSWGQCFLNDASVVGRIVDVSHLDVTDTVVEIGAGVGTLTVALARVAGHVIAIERDRDLAAVLRHELAGIDNVEIAEQNALTFDYAGIGAPIKIVGNLPYNISSPLLFRIIARRHHIPQATLMFQRELVSRIVARPGNRTYGIPSVMCQQYATVQQCFTVKAGAFVPPPRVDSAVALFTMREQPVVACDEELFHAVVHAAFGARRKTLKNALGARFVPTQVMRAMGIADIAPTCRAETLSVDDFGRLAMAFASIGVVA